MLSKDEGSGDIVRLEAHGYSMYRLQNPLTWIETLVDSANARDWLLKHQQDPSGIYIVTRLQKLRGGKLTEYNLGDPGSHRRKRMLELLFLSSRMKKLKFASIRDT